MPVVPGHTQAGRGWVHPRRVVATKEGYARPPHEENYCRAVRTVPHATQGDGGNDDDDGRTAEDAELELAFRAGKDGALEAAYRRHGRTVYTFARRAAGDDLADELTQDVFVSAWASASRYDPDRGALGGWLLGICRHKVVDALRRRERAAARIERAGALAGPPPSATDADRLAERLAIGDCLRILRPEARQVVELAFYSDMTHEQIAAATERPLGTVKAQIRRSLVAMRRYLEGIDAAS